jgi:tRNA threonylcarbamoyladenosine biosynthesis protein TsaB
MSLILGFDTATADTSVAVCTPAGKQLGGRLVGPGDGGRPRHAPALLAAIEAAVAEAGGWSLVSLIAVGIGPGSFTGVRIGVSTARALAQGHGLPVAGVSSPGAVAAGVAEARGRRRRAALGVIDARRGEIFAELARPGSDRRAGSDTPVVCAPGDLIEVLPAAAGTLAGGDGAIRFRSELEAIGIATLDPGDPAHRVSGRHVCILAGAAEPGPVEHVVPRYLRRPDAERWLERDRGD